MIIQAIQEVKRCRFLGLPVEGDPVLWMAIPLSWEGGLNSPYLVEMQVRGLTASERRLGYSITTSSRGKQIKIERNVN